MSEIHRIEDGHELWLRYRRVADAGTLKAYREAFAEIVVQNAACSPTLSALREELEIGLRGLLGVKVPCADSPTGRAAVVAGALSSSPLIRSLGLDSELKTLGREGFILRSMKVAGSDAIVAASLCEIGALYGAFRLLMLLQAETTLSSIAAAERPRIASRQLNHWETTRCYAGGNIWDWDGLPGRIDPKYKVYARANASIGINGTVLNNVNAGRIYLSPEYLEKEKALADLFRPYGIRVFLSANFSAPVTLGGLDTADPAEPKVLEWWKKKCDEIYAAIPDFGGFVVKANSEGEPGPKDYGRSHAEGANLLAKAIAGHGGVVMWRAFVYDPEVDEDRLKRAFKEFTPLDGKFEPNVFVQAKNGPLDFQPREPFNPLFGKMPRTPLAMEFQISQEYLGQGDHLVYLAPMWKEVLDADTFAEGSGSTVAKVVDGSLHGYPMTAIAAVANTGSDRNWCGQIFGQANWYAYGRFAWDHCLSPEGIAEEWTRATWGNNPKIVETVVPMMMGSREACVDYMTPLGLGHLMARDHHFGPQPDDKVPGHLDWSPTYYHRADTQGLGCDRSVSGSGLTGQYFEEVGKVFNDIDTCPEDMLCWFHHVPWTRKMKSGRTFWEDLCSRYEAGLSYVSGMRARWETLRSSVDGERFAHVEERLRKQEADAKVWRDTCLKYFQGFSEMRIPDSPGPRDER